jgi:DUF2911 family protein
MKALLLVAAATGIVPLNAQIRASERARASQVVDGTTITLDYARPRMRGRHDVFGRSVSWGEVWTPGANMATTLETDHEIVLGGQAVPKGKYSVWMVTDRGTQWTMVLDTVWEQYHEDHPPARPGQLRWPVTSAMTPATEVLTWSFPAVTATGGTLRMAWADRTVELPFTVPPSHPATTPRAEALPLVGRYRVTWKPESSMADASTAQQTVDVTYDAGILRARWRPRLWGPEETTYLIRMAAGWFSPGFIEKGEVVDVFSEWVMEFDVKGGQAVGFEMRGERDAVMATGVRE